MSFLNKLRPARLVPAAIEAAEYGAASFAYGYAQNRWRDKATIKGVPLDLLGGVVFKAASLLTAGKMAHHLSIFGNAGVGAWAHTMGAGYGAKASGVRRLLVSAADADKVKKQFPGATVLGAIAPAPHGAFLSSEKLRDLAR